LNDAVMARLLLLCRHPHHLQRQEGEAWLRQEVEAVLRGDGLQRARLTGLETAWEGSTRSWDWLIELQVDDESRAGALSARGACGALVADLRLLGMSPTVVMAADRNTIDVEPA
jgi:hypothetical protein